MTSSEFTSRILTWRNGMLVLACSCLALLGQPFYDAGEKLLATLSGGAMFAGCALIALARARAAWWAGASAAAWGLAFPLAWTLASNIAYSLVLRVATPASAATPIGAPPPDLWWQHGAAAAVATAVCAGLTAAILRVVTKSVGVAAASLVVAAVTTVAAFGFGAARNGPLIIFGPLAGFAAAFAPAFWQGAHAAILLAWSDRYLPPPTPLLARRSRSVPAPPRVCWKCGYTMEDDATGICTECGSLQGIRSIEDGFD